VLRIRLARIGRKKLAHYRVVVSESHRVPTGGAPTQIGYFDPHTEELQIETDTLQYYLDRGAQPSERIVRLLRDRDDITLPEQTKQNSGLGEDKDGESQAAPSEDSSSAEPATKDAAAD